MGEQRCQALLAKHSHGCPARRRTVEKQSHEEPTTTTLDSPRVSRARDACARSRDERSKPLEPLLPALPRSPRSQTTITRRNAPLRSVARRPLTSSHADSRIPPAPAPDHSRFHPLESTRTCPVLGLSLKSGRETVRASTRESLVLVGLHARTCFGRSPSANQTDHLERSTFDPSS